MKKLKLAVIGLSFGGILIETDFLHGGAGEYFIIDSVCDLDEQKAQHWGERLNVPHYTEFFPLLDARKPDAILLITPPQGRAELIKVCADRGVHVMTTKPFELSSAAAMDALTYAGQKRITVHTNSPTTLPTAAMAKIYEYIEKFDLGKPIAYRAETWCRYHETATGSWHDDPSKCPCAPIFRVGVYMINDLIGLFGDVDKISTFESRIFTGRPTPDNAMLGLLHKNGAIGSIFASFCIGDMQDYKYSAELNFENGTIYKAVVPKPRDGKINLNLVYAKDGKQHFIEEEVEDTPSYMWDVFYNTINGKIYENSIKKEQIVAAVKVLEKLFAVAEKRPRRL